MVLLTLMIPIQSSTDDEQSMPQQPIWYGMVIIQYRVMPFLVQLTKQIVIQVHQPQRMLFASSTSSVRTAILHHDC
jgi:hypothetical protein